MTEKEYFAQIKEIRKHILSNRLDRAEELLEKMYIYKPVRLLWFVAKAEYILKKEHDPAAALKVLDGKYYSGADYPGLKACMKFRADTFRQMGRERDAAREEYIYQRACGKRGSRAEAVLAKALEDFAEDTESREALDALGNAFYQMSDMAAYFIVRMVQRQRGDLLEDDRSERFYHSANFGYFEEQLCSKNPKTFILMMDENLNREIEILGYLLHCLGHQVVVLGLPLPFETEEPIEIGQTLMVSIDNMERYPDMDVIPPVVLTRKGVPYGDNRDYIIDYICRQETGCDYAMLLCGGKLFDEVYQQHILRGRIGRLSPYESDIQEEKLQFGWTGDYLTYISNLYGYDVRTDVYAEPEVDFSILIPARNSARTLRYTLETCLNQHYTGRYEIVVNDNSAEGNREIYDLCQTLNDPKIRYVKTPYNMVLAKSFEFGYLHTRGEFVFSIGSDDGVFPWALDTLKRVLEQFPYEEIIQWDRGFYAWPGFNGGQEHMFQIPRQYDKGKLNIYYEKTSAIFDQIKEDQQAIYVMPLLYINSGFRRKYLKTLLEKTGKLLDGPNQDTQTGIINCCINKQILQIIYPLTIAGMSSNSIGYLENRITRKAGQEQNHELFQWANKGVWVGGTRDRLMPKIGADACGVFFVMSYAVMEGLLDEEEADRIFNWDKAVLRSFESVFPFREDYEACVFLLNHVAKKLGDKQAKWFENMRVQMLRPRCLDEQQIEQHVAKKSYQEGLIVGGGEVLDASKYGVCNIAEAVELFAKRTGL